MRSSSGAELRTIAELQHGGDEVYSSLRTFVRRQVANSARESLS